MKIHAVRIIKRSNVLRTGEGAFFCRGKRPERLIKVQFRLPVSAPVAHAPLWGNAPTWRCITSRFEIGAALKI